MSRLARKSLNVCFASSKITVGGLGISTKGFGRGCCESAIKVSFGELQALLSSALTSAKRSQLGFLDGLVMVKALNHIDEAAAFSGEFALQIRLRLAYLSHR